VSRHVLVVDDDELIRWSLTERLRAEGYEVSEAGTAASAIEAAESGVDVVLLDYQLPDGDGIAVLKKIREMNPDAPVIMLTAYQNVSLVVEAMKAGAFDYASKPFDLDDITLRVRRSLETTRPRREPPALRANLSRPYGPASLIGESQPMRRVRALVKKVAASSGSTVLITGESGTGKDLVAKVIHYSSSRAARPFLNITCSLLPEVLLESELFGHERGAFSDARQQKRGLFEQADAGTVFLDDIGEMPSMLQAKLLRFLEENAFRRVGGSVDIQVDVRVIAATNRNLEEQVRDGKFRDDLYYRLNVLRVDVPPLRARGNDIALLARFFVATFQKEKEFERHARTLSAAAETALKAYAWPGNVRELRNLAERAVLLADHRALQPSDFETRHAAHAVAVSGHAGINLPAGGVQLEDVERTLVVQALERVGGNRTRAAMLLGLHRDQIRYRIDKFGLARKS
jgi:two-component system, NtrC family, response regulator AtoC